MAAQENSKAESLKALGLFLSNLRVISQLKKGLTYSPHENKAILLFSHKSSWPLYLSLKNGTSPFLDFLKRILGHQAEHSSGTFTLIPKLG